MGVPCFFCTHWQPVDINDNTRTANDMAAKCDVKGKFTTKFESCECSKAWNPAEGGRNVRAVVTKPDTEKPVGAPKVRVNGSKHIHNTRGSSIDSDFDSEPMYAHQQEVVDMFDDKAFGGLGMQMGTGKSRAVLEIATRKWQRKEIDALLVIAPNQVHCITGDAWVHYCVNDNRWKLVTLKQFYRTFYDLKDTVCIRGLVDNRFDKIVTKAVVFKGVQSTRKIVFTNSKHLCCTADHQILTPTGYVRASDLEAGDKVIGNGAYANQCPECGVIFTTQRRNRSKVYPGLCSSCRRTAENFKRKGDSSFIDEWGYKILTGPQIADCMNLYTRGGVPEHRAVMQRSLGRNLESWEIVHHINEDKQDNRLENLQLTSSAEHSAHHATLVPTEYEVYMNMEWGAQEVYDVVCEEPHNFVANSIVVHNCQWAKEQIPKWLKLPYDIQCLYGNGGAKKAYSFDDDPELLQIIVVNIDTFSQPAKWKDIADWANQHKTMIILDEATAIKNVTSKRTQNILYGFSDVVYKGKTVLSNKPKSVCRYALTGTPVTNNITDLWAIQEFMSPNFFKRNYYSFKNYYGMFTSMAVNDRIIDVPLTEEWWHSIKGCASYFEAKAICGCSEDTFNWVQAQDHYEGPYKHADILKEQIKDVWYFKLLKDCVDMPPQNYIVRSLEMSPEQRQCYDSMRDEYIAQYETHTATALSKLTVYIRLQQISSGFLCDKTIVDMADPDTVDVLPSEIKWIGTTNPKLEQLYRDIEGSAKPCIVVTRFTAEADRIFNDLSYSYKTCLVTGWKKVGSIDEFKSGKYEVMVANIASIYRGFNLQNSHVIMSYSNTFSLEMRDQLEGRIYRIGQGEPCEYLDYLNKNSIDEKIVASLQLRRNLLDFVRSGQVTLKDIL